MTLIALLTIEIIAGVLTLSYAALAIIQLNYENKLQVGKSYKRSAKFRPNPSNTTEIIATITSIRKNTFGNTEIRYVWRTAGSHGEEVKEAETFKEWYITS